MNDSFVIARELDEAARAIHDRLIDEWDRLSPTERDMLEREFRDIIAAAMRLRTFGVDQLLDGTQASVDLLTNVTDQARDKIKTLNDVRKAIKVATALFGLAASISAAVAAPHPGAILAAAGSLKTVIDTVST